ncbi:MAG: ester cyclase [Bacteroidota bacterium]|nr:ester cyclase [Bacteroidota bacterium]
MRQHTGIAICITVTGTFENDWLGMKATGKKITYTGVNINRVVDGLIVEHGGAANMLGPLLSVHLGLEIGINY